MDNKPLITDDKRYNDEDTGKFVEDNPGRPKGAKNKFSLAKLEEAIEEEEKTAINEGDVGLFRKFVRMAYMNPNVMIAIMKKFVPDKQHIQTEEIEPIKLIIEHVGNKNKSNKDL